MGPPPLNRLIYIYSYIAQSKTLEICSESIDVWNEEKLTISIPCAGWRFFYNKQFLLHVHTWIRPNHNRSAVHTPFLFRVLLPPDCRHGMFSNTCPATLIISPLPSFLFPPLSLHVPCVSHSPHAKNRCDNIIGASGRTGVRLTGKRCWGSLQSDTTCGCRDEATKCAASKRCVVYGKRLSGRAFHLQDYWNENDFDKMWCKAIWQRQYSRILVVSWKLTDVTEVPTAPIMKRRSTFTRLHSVIALKMNAVRTYETSVNFYETIRRNIPADYHLHRKSWWSG
jgi:hypothetical protein